MAVVHCGLDVVKWMDGDYEEYMPTIVAFYRASIEVESHSNAAQGDAIKKKRGRG